MTWFCPIRNEKGEDIGVTYMLDEVGVNGVRWFSASVNRAPLGIFQQMGEAHDACLRHYEAQRIAQLAANQQGLSGSRPSRGSSSRPSSSSTYSHHSYGASGYGMMGMAAAGLAGMALGESMASPSYDSGSSCSYDSGSSSSYNSGSCSSSDFGGGSSDYGGGTVSF